MFGPDGGKCWDEGLDYKKCTLGNLYKMASTTFFTVPDEDMSAKLDQAQLAETTYTEATEGCGLDTKDNETLSTYTGIAKKARIQKVMSSSMKILKKGHKQ